MLTSILLQARNSNNLILVDGGICRFTRRGDGSIKILDILSIQKGAGTRILEQVKNMNPTRIIAHCPLEWESNDWYRNHNFRLIGQELSPKGKSLNVWELNLCAGYLG